MQVDAAALQNSPAWHVYDFDAMQGTSSLLRLDEAAYRAASFLDQRAVPLASARGELPLADLQAALMSPRVTRPDPHYIFHLGHCGSTLLSRALAASGAILPVREPLTLRRLANEPRSAPYLPMVTAAHARVFHPGQVAVIKATSTCNSLIAPLLSVREGSRAILMYVSLESYLAGMLGRLSQPKDLQALAAIRMADWSAITGAPALDAERLTSAQLAVLAWLTGMRHLAAAAAQDSARCRLLDFEDFLANPEMHLARCAEFLGLKPETPAMLHAWPDISTSYSKQPDQPYSAFNRRATLQRGRQTRGAEIRQGLEWAKGLIAGVDGLRGCREYVGGAGV